MLRVRAAIIAECPAPALEAIDRFVTRVVRVAPVLCFQPHGCHVVAAVWLTDQEEADRGRSQPT